MKKLLLGLFFIVEISQAQHCHVTSRHYHFISVSHNNILEPRSSTNTIITFDNNDITVVSDGIELLKFKILSPITNGISKGYHYRKVQAFEATTGINVQLQLFNNNSFKIVMSKGNFIYYHETWKQ